jgi:hypothetical protein
LTPPSAISGDQYHDFGLALFLGYHIYYLNTVLDILGFAALYAQARIVRARAAASGPGALSLTGVAMQAGFPWESGGRGRSWSVAISWFLHVGYVPFYNAVFAFAQFVLLWLAVLLGYIVKTSRGCLPARGSRCWGAKRALMGELKSIRREKKKKKKKNQPKPAPVRAWEAAWYPSPSRTQS